MSGVLGRKRLVIGNWKMHGLVAENAARLTALSAATVDSSAVDVAVCVPFPYLLQASQALQGTAIGVGAQDVSPHGPGAHTGDVSAAMLADTGCQYVLVGHSERRATHAETDQAVADKARAALAAGLTPVVCIGETLAEQKAGHTLGVVSRQLAPVLALGTQAVNQLVIAYEPVWAIGTGHTATPDQAQQVHEAIRASLHTADAGQVRVLYGGSVNADNAASLFAMPDIDGALVGGASLKAPDFLSIVAA
ncbi:MAG TPA: triose-phosphate isomerase [Burkholderiaceae bacterium]|nr:triose-phosphate isomerase [Burkholderiaceae bacterium]